MPKDKTKKCIASETPNTETPQKSTKQPKNTPVPDPDLPSKTLKPAHTQWLEKYKEVYRSNVATRGTRSNPATDWVKNNITQPFIAEFFPDLSDDQKAHFAVFVWRSLYSWLHHSTNKTEKIAKTYSPSTRICTQWVWLVDHMDFVAKEWHNKCAGNPALMNNIGARRCFVLKLFQSQSSEVKRTYEEKCADIKAKLKMQGELDAKGTEEPGLGGGLGAPPGRRTPSLPASTPPPATQPARIPPPKSLPVSVEEAKKELVSRKLIAQNTEPSLNTLINILLAFTGKEETTDGLGEPREIVNAVGRLLETEVMRWISKATADATAERMLSMREAERTFAGKELEEERKKLEEREKAVALAEEKVRGIAAEQEKEGDRLKKEKEALEIERRGVAGRGPQGEEGLRGMEMAIGKLGELLEKMGKERLDWEEARKKEKENVGAGAGYGYSYGYGGGYFGGGGGVSGGFGDYGGQGGHGEVEFGGGWGSGEGGHCGGRPNSYAEAARAGGPRGSSGEWGSTQVPTAKEVEESAERLRRAEERRARQLMLDAEAVNGNKGLKGLSLQDLLEKAFKALNEIEETSLLEGRPEKVEFVGASVQRQGGVLYELGTKEARDWLVRPDVCEKFTENFGCAVKYRSRRFPVLVEFVPVEFNVNREDTIDILTQSNELPEGSISALKWVRDPKRRDAEQRHAHLIVYCNSKEAANDWILYTRTIEGKEVASTKLLPEPMRCYNCQLDGHQARQCMDRVVCGSCGENHQTDECTNRKNLYCVTCKEKGHPTWSTACPNYVTRCKNLTDRIPDNRYKYYLTSEEWTWELLSNDANRRRFRAPRPRRSPAPPTTGVNATPLPARPNAKHPRPGNLAQPTPGGTTVGPRQRDLHGWLGTSSPNPGPAALPSGSEAAPQQPAPANTTTVNTSPEAPVTTNA